MIYGEADRCVLEQRVVERQIMVVLDLAGGPLGADERAVPPHGSGAGTAVLLYNEEACPRYCMWRDTSFVISNILT